MTATLKDAELCKLVFENSPKKEKARTESTFLHLKYDNKICKVVFTLYTAIQGHFSS